MGTLAAGIKEIFATAKTTGSNVMLCGNDGTPDGHMTMENLASVLGGLQGVYEKFIPYASVDKGYTHIQVTVNQETLWLEYTISGSKNSTYAKHPIKCLIGFEAGSTRGIFANYICGSGKVYYYQDGNTLNIIIASDFDVDYSVGNVRSNLPVMYARTINRSGFDLSSYTEVTTYNNAYDIPDFYKSYSDLSSLASALGVGKPKTYMSSSDNSRFVKIVITSGYNSALLGICGQYNVSKPQIVNLYFQTSTNYEAKGYIQDGGKVYVRKEGYSCEFYIGGATLFVSLLSGTGVNMNAVQISEVTSLPSDVVEVTVS